MICSIPFALNLSFVPLAESAPERKTHRQGCLAVGSRIDRCETSPMSQLSADCQNTPVFCTTDNTGNVPRASTVRTSRRPPLPTSFAPPYKAQNPPTSSLWRWAHMNRDLLGRMLTVSINFTRGHVYADETTGTDPRSLLMEFHGDKLNDFPGAAQIHSFDSSHSFSRSYQRPRQNPGTSKRN